MPAMVSVHSSWLITAACVGLFEIVYPLVLAAVAHQRLRVAWRYFGYGAFIFFLFQIISRVPIVAVLGNVLAPQLKASAIFRFTWLAILALTAGLFEEIGRYVGYRWLMRREEKTWNKAIMYGLGHGGLESMLLVGGVTLYTVINLAAVSSLNLNTLPASQHARVVQQVAAINAQPIWLALLGGWERLWTVPFHVGMSVVVLQVFRRNNISWLWLAVLLHAIVDFVSVILLQLLGSSVSTSLLVEGFVMVAGLFGLWLIWRLRDRPTHDDATTDSSAPIVSDMPMS